MTPADGIRKLGFRRWYERQLIESHAYFVTCFLCMIVVAACFEGIGLKGEPLQLLAQLGIVLAAGAIGIASLKRYKVLLDRAEYFAEQCNCPRCGEYGRVQVLAGGSEIRDGEADRGDWIRVRCRKCKHEWLIE